MRAVYDRCIDIRRMGAASLDFCDVACGRLDAYAECRLNPWDYAAGLLIVREAGGTVTDLRGGSPDMFTPSDIVAANGTCHRGNFGSIAQYLMYIFYDPRALRRGDFFAHDINFKKIAGFSVVRGRKSFVEYTQKDRACGVCVCIIRRPRPGNVSTLNKEGGTPT